MDVLQFIAAVIGAIAWPATVIVLAVLLRAPVAQILLTITRLKFKDLELDFGRELKQIERQAKEIEVLPAQAPSVGGPKTAEELLDEAERLVDQFPEPAVAVAWSAVEERLTQAAERLSLSENFRRYSPGRLIQSLLESGFIDSQIASVLKRMQNLRNVALHERGNAFGGISPDEAREFIALAKGMDQKLAAIAAPP